MDYFLISILIGSLLASSLKNYFSEKTAMERLKKSIIDKSIESNLPILESKKSKIKRIYKFALTNRGGTLELDDLQKNLELSNELMKLSQNIQHMVEKLAAFLKEREMKGALKIFFRHGRLILELILFQCKIQINYANYEVVGGLSTQVIVFTATTGGALGFTLSWFSAALVTPPSIASILLLRSLCQQILNYKDFLKLKKNLAKILKDKDIRETIREIVFMDDTAISPKGIEMPVPDLDKNPPLKHNFNVESSEEPDKFIKKILEEKFGLVENPTETQLEQIIKIKKKRKGKTVYYRDFIKGITNSESDFDFIDAEIVDIDKKISSSPSNEL